MSSYKIVVLGGGSVGKSAMTVRLVSNHFLAVYDPTVEESYRTQTTIDGEPAVLEIIDTAGQEEYNAIKDAHIVKGQGFLLVFSLTSRQSFDELEDIHARIYHLKEKDPCKDNIPIVIAGNKCDLEAERCVALTEGEDLAKNWRCKFHASLFHCPQYACLTFFLSRSFASFLLLALPHFPPLFITAASALSKINVEESFYDIVRLIRQSTAPQKSSGSGGEGGGGRKRLCTLL